MWTPLQRFGCAVAAVTGLAGAEIGWKSVWLEPRNQAVLLPVGATPAYIVTGRNDVDVKSDVTKSEYMYLTSSDPGVLEIDRVRGRMVAKKPGHAHVFLAFRHLADMTPVFVRPAASPSGSIDGVWRAEFTAPVGERPKMVSEIFFDLNAAGDTLTGTVHAASWPGDGPITDGMIEGDRVRFTMVGTLPFTANGVVGYPKLCFNGTRSGSEMKIDLLWTEASRSCEDARHQPMAAKKMLD